jgi:hypothetical protein
MTNDEIDIELEALRIASQSLSAFAIGQGEGRLKGHEAVLIGVTHHWQPTHQMFPLVAEMIIDMVENVSISPLKIARYQMLLAMATKYVKGKKTFRRKKNVKCLSPNTHPRNCACAKPWMEKVVQQQPIVIPINRKAEKAALKNAIEAFA